ncbi:MAG TPA: DivIVA domain-containing protein [Firmicutes bacterium]|nr:DivIVA domain-containing protein [Bacillota bacterium]
MLTPRDIHEAKFKRILRGYDPEEVDKFLERVVLEYSQVYDENQNLRKKIAELEEQIASYSRLHDSIDEVLRTAQQNAKALQESSAKQAESMVASAKLEAERIQKEAEATLARQKVVLQQLMEKEQIFRTQLETYVRSFLEFLQNASPPEQDFTVTRKEAAVAADELME